MLWLIYDLATVCPCMIHCSKVCNNCNLFYTYTAGFAVIMCLLVMSCVHCVLVTFTKAYRFVENMPIFRELNADEVNVGSIEATEVESMCMECGRDVSAWVVVQYEV